MTPTPTCVPLDSTTCPSLGPWSGPRRLLLVRGQEWVLVKGLVGPRRVVCLSESKHSEVPPRGEGERWDSWSVTSWTDTGVSFSPLSTPTPFPGQHTLPSRPRPRGPPPGSSPAEVPTSPPLTRFLCQSLKLGKGSGRGLCRDRGFSERFESCGRVVARAPVCTTTSHLTCPKVPGPPTVVGMSWGHGGRYVLGPRSSFGEVVRFVLREVSLHREAAPRPTQAFHFTP